MKKAEIALLIVYLFVAVAVRLYHLTDPVADWHSWRQVDTASVARMYVRDGIDLLHPRYHDLSNIPSGKDNLQGWRMVEFPLYQAIGAATVKVIPSLSIEVALRLLTMISSVATGLLLIALVRHIADPLTGILAGFLYAILPYSVYYGRVILPEPFAVFWVVLSIYLLSLSDKEHKGWRLIVFAAIAGAIALLVKPTAAFLLIPAFYLLWRTHGFSTHSFIRLFVYLFICLFPVWWWRGWIAQFPEGIPAYTWLFNEGNIRFKGAWFYWLFAERLGKLILGYWGLIPFGLGMLVPAGKREGWLFRWLALGSLLYLVVFAAGNVRHDYYQILLLPIVCVTVAKGFAFLLTQKVFSKLFTFHFSLFTFLFMLAFSWYTIRTYYWINRPEIVEAGIHADQLLPPDAKVIAPYNGDTTFLYQTKRQGWPLGFDIPNKIAAGATHYVTVSPTDNDFETKGLAEQYTVLVRNDKYAIIDLTKPK